MAGKVRRARGAHRSLAPRIEGLETRALLNAASLTTGPSRAIDPATSLMVGFRPGASSAAVHAALRSVGGWIAERFPDGSDVVGLPATVDPAAAVARLQASRAVAYAERDGTIQAAGIPNDP